MNLSRLLSVVVFIAIAIAIAIAGCAGNMAPTMSSAQQAAIAQIDESLKLVAGHHFAQAESVIQPVIHAKNFERLPSAEQYRALLTAARLGYTLNHPKLEYESRVRLLALPEATSEDRASRVRAAYRLQDTAEIVIGLTDMARKSLERLEKFNAQFILGVIWDAKRKLPHRSTLPLLEELYAAHWKTKWDQEPSGLWTDLALLLLEQNRVTEAIDVSSHATDEYAVISMRADRRFDAITAANPPQFEVDMALKRDLEHFQSAAERAPKSLTPKTAVIGLLMEQQHYGAALAAADGVVADIRMRGDAKQWYDDFDDEYAWVLDRR